MPGWRYYHSRHKDDPVYRNEFMAASDEINRYPKPTVK
jgi:hypothetical protein